MTTTEPAPTTPIAVTPTAAGTFLLVAGDDAVELTIGQADDLANSLRRQVYEHAPALRRVLGYQDQGTGDHVALTDEEVSVYQAEGWELIHGLQCPHCQAVAWDGAEDGVIRVVDEDQRWCRFDYRWTAKAESITGSYDESSNYEGLGYLCGECLGIITLPEGVEEDGF